MNLGKKIIASHGGGCKPDRDINRYLTLIDAKQVNMDMIVTESIDLSQSMKQSTKSKWYDGWKSDY